MHYCSLSFTILVVVGLWLLLRSECAQKPKHVEHPFRFLNAEQRKTDANIFNVFLAFDIH